MEQTVEIPAEDLAPVEEPRPILWECLHDKLIVKRDPPETEYVPGITVPDKHKQHQNVGTVLKTGAGRWTEGMLVPLTIKPGMRVIFSKLSGTELASDQPDVILLREDEILAYVP